MNKGKIIEEMANAIADMSYCRGYEDDRGCYLANSCIACQNANREKSIEIAERLTEQGYRKQVQGEWKIMKMGDGGNVRTCSACLISQTVNVYNGKVDARNSIFKEVPERTFLSIGS